MVMRDMTGKLLCVPFIAATVGILAMSCADEFDMVTDVKKLRVMGVSVSPPEIRPDYTGPVDIQVLWHDPQGGGRSVEFAWVLCAGNVPTATGYQACELLDSVFLPPVVVDAGSGGDTFEVPVIPVEVYEDIPEGTSFAATAIVLICAGGLLPPADELITHQETNNINALCEGGDGLSAYKTIKIANGNEFDDEPNTNPEIQTFSLDGRALTPVDASDLDAHTPDGVSCFGGDGCDVNLGVTASFSDESYQVFTTVEFDEPVPEKESPYISWFGTGGEFDGTHSISNSPDDAPEVKWNPKEPGDYILWAVANDRRGGVSWQEFRVSVK